jgi:hypothetical protein
MNTKPDETNTSKDENIVQKVKNPIFTKIIAVDLLNRLISGLIFGIIFFVLACIFGLWAKTSAHNQNDPLFWNRMFAMAYSLSLGGFLVGYISEWPTFRQTVTTKWSLQNLLISLFFSLILGLIGSLVLPSSSDNDFITIISFFGGGVFFGVIAMAYFSGKKN